MMKAALLPDRGVVKVAGDDAAKLLNGIVTVDAATVAPGRARYAALLTPQGKIVTDFFIAGAAPQDGGGLFLDCPRALASTLVQRLNLYKLRAKVMVEDLSEALCVLAIWGGSAETEFGLCYGDPRLPELGARCMLPPHLAERGESPALPHVALPGERGRVGVRERPYHLRRLAGGAFRAGGPGPVRARPAPAVRR